LLAAAFRRHGAAVSRVTIAAGAPGRTELVCDLGDRQPRDRLVTEPTWCGFTGTALDFYLRGKGARAAVLSGVAGGIGVEPTGCRAYDLGFIVTLAVDAMTADSLARIFPRLGETGTTREIIDLLGKHA